MLNFTACKMEQKRHEDNIVQMIRDSESAWNKET
jgi:hypothetical protein